MKNRVIAGLWLALIIGMPAVAGPGGVRIGLVFSWCISSFWYSASHLRGAEGEGEMTFIPWSPDEPQWRPSQLQSFTVTYIIDKGPQSLEGYGPSGSVPRGRA